jgi:hypothetical protein
VTNLNCNLSVSPATRNVKRESTRAVQTIKEAPHNESRECSVCEYALYPATGRCTNQECPQHIRTSGAAMTGAELLREYAPPPLFHGRKWGEWVLDAERLTLAFRGKPVSRGDGSNVTEGVERYVAYLGHYEIDIEAIRRSSQLLDWVFQVGGKTWATARVTKDLINAFDSIFHPQQNLCSGGGDKIIQNPKAFLKRRIATMGKDGPLRDAA